MEYSGYFGRRRVLRMTHYFFQRKYFFRAFTLFAVLAGSGSVVLKSQTPEEVVSWTAEVWPTTDTTGTPFVMQNFPKSSATCNLTPIPPPPDRIVNPTSFRVSDPVNPGKECLVPAAGFFNSVPLGASWYSTVRALGMTTQSARSALSNSFDRVAVTTPPATPGKPGVTDLK